MSVVEWRPPRRLTAEMVETWLSELPPSEDLDRVRIHLGAWERSGPFADAYLQGAICWLLRSGVVVDADIPDLTFRSSERADRAFRQPDPLNPPSGPTTPTERLLATSVGGLIVGQLAQFGNAHADIRALQRGHLDARDYFYGWGEQSARVVPVDESNRRRPTGDLRTRYARFYYALRDLLGVLSPRDRDVLLGQPRSRNAQFQDLAVFAFEAAENTYDHGRYDFDGAPIRQVRFIQVRRVPLTDQNGTDVAEIAAAIGSPVTDYLERIRRSIRESRTFSSLLEVTIADGGLGIPAWMANSLKVYGDEYTLQEEQRYLAEALLPDRSTKPPGEVGRGQGFRKMLRATHGLGGLAVIRTGRSRLSHTYVLPDGTTPEVNFENPEAKAYLVGFNVEALPVMAGTVVSLLFPIASAR